VLRAADEIEQLLGLQSHDNDDWEPEEQLSDADFHSQQRYKLRPSSLHTLLVGDHQQQQPATVDGFAKRRAHIFVGKRSGSSHQFSLRPEAVAALTSDIERQRFVDDDDSEISDDKRSRMFVGKRPTSAFLDSLDTYVDESGRLMSPASNRMREQLLTAEKRPRMFVGKKYAPVFVGKRSTDEARERKMASRS
jgi:hypothetical protein